MTTDELFNLLPGLKAILEKHPGWLEEAVDTPEASRLTGVPIESLTTLRSRGGGPLYTRPKNSRLVRYIRRHLYEWLLSGGVLSNTQDTPKP
jgi:hypothetical protein